jgi:hypothetical protein
MIVTGPGSRCLSRSSGRWVVWQMFAMSWWSATQTARGLAWSLFLMSYMAFIALGGGQRRYPVNGIGWNGDDALLQERRLGLRHVPEYTP